VTSTGYMALVLHGEAVVANAVRGSDEPLLLGQIGCGALFGEEPPPSDTAATIAPATAAPARGASHQMCRRSMGSLYRRRRAPS